MGWEVRKGRRYYYRATRVGRRVVKSYLGTGPAAQLAAVVDDNERADWSARTHAAALDRASRADAAALLDALDAAIDAAAAVVLFAAGFHRHRGQWRRVMSQPRPPAPADPAPAGVSDLPAISPEAWAAAMKARAGDKSALPDARPLLDDPRLVAVFGGDLVDRAEQALAAAACGADLLAREAVKRKLNAVRAELAGPAPTAVERLLAERAAVCWLNVYHLEQQAAAAPAELADDRQRAVDRAHRRYLSALKTLAAIRRLAVPAIQVNVARRQVNLAAAPPGTA
ncbi:MAG: hypothetical protein U0871_19295 [Gemmataceae bacterium]